MAAKRLADVKVGDTFETSRTCGPYQPLYYAAVSGDFNPIHIDPAFGAAAGLDGVILHGMCTMGWAAEAVVGFLGDPALLSRLRVRFRRPVRIADTITFRGRIKTIEGDLISGDLSAANQRGEDVLTATLFEARLS